MSGKETSVELKIDRLERSWSQLGSDYVNDLSWSPDSSRLARADASGRVAVLYLKDNNNHLEWHAHDLGALRARWSTSGQYLASCGQDGTAQIYDMAGNRLALCAHGSEWVEHLAWHAKQDMFLSGAGKNLRLWDATGNLIREFSKQKSTIADITWNPAAPDLFATSCYGGVRLWNYKDPMPKRLLDWKGSILNISYSPTGKVLAAGCQDGAAHVWLLPSAEDLFMNGYPTKVRELSWDASSRYLATGGGAEIIVWDFSGKGPSGSKPLILPGHEGFISVLAFAPRGRKLASGGLDGKVFVWDIENETSVLLNQQEDSDVSCLCWSPDGKALAAGFASGLTTIFRVQ